MGWHHIVRVLIAQLFEAEMAAFGDMNGLG
jgi:hypothetical protein